jgi:hypothetical protein
VKRKRKMAQYSIRRHMARKEKATLPLRLKNSLVEEEIKKTLQFNLNYKVIAIRSNRVTNLA